MTTPSGDSEKPGSEIDGSPQSEDVKRQLKRFRVFIISLLVYGLLFVPIGASYWWSRQLASQLGPIVAMMAMLPFYCIALVIFYLRLFKWDKYQTQNLGKRLRAATKFIVLLVYALVPFFLINVYILARELPWSNARSQMNSALRPIGRGLVLISLVAIGVLGHALVSYRYTGGKLSDLFSLTKLSERNRLRTFLERRRRLTNRWLLVSLGQFLLPISIVASIYLLAAKIYPNEVITFISGHQMYATLCGLVIAYLLGGLIRDLQRHGYRMFALPLYGMLFLFGLLVLAIVFAGKWGRVADELAKNGPWLLLLVALIIVLGPQIRPFLQRVQKAELPGGMKLELGEMDKLDEVHRSVSPWRKTVTRFEELIQLVVELIRDTPDDDVVRFLAYTPALGYLTLAEKEWERLHALLVRKQNIQITCLNYEDLENWHRRFEGKETRRAVKSINTDLIRQANEVSMQILDLKQRQQRRKSDPRVKLVQVEYKKLPGYYLFANSNRAIIATPLFLPTDIEGNDPEVKQANDGPDYSGMPGVQILGFESTDNWTVWLVHKVCDRYKNWDTGKLKSAPSP